MSLFNYFLKETPVADPTTPTTPPAAPAGPVQVVLDSVLDKLLAATVLHPVAHLALIEVKAGVDRLAPLVAADLEKLGFKIVKV